MNIAKFFQDLMINFPEEYQAKLANDLPAIFFLNNRSNPIQLDKMLDQLNVYFEKVIPIQVHPFLNIVCAQNPKPE